MTLKRLAILLAILIFLAGVGIAWLWQYAYTPEGRARVIIAQLKNDTSTFRGWLLQHHLVRPGFSAPPLREGEETPVHENAVALVAAGEMARLGPEVKPIVIQALRDDERKVRIMAASACGTFRDPAAIQPLVQCTRDAFHDKPNGQQDMPPFIQTACLTSLVEIGPEAEAPLLEAAKNCRQEALREWMPKSLAKKWGPAAVPCLIKLLDYGDSYIQACAADELGKFKDARAIDALIPNLGDGSDAVKESAAKALDEIGDRKVIPALLRTLKDATVANGIRTPVAGMLARKGRNEGLQFLLAALKSPDLADRYNSVTELGKIKYKAALEPLLGLLKDSDTSVRWAAIEALGELHDPRAIPAIRKLLKDPDDGVRQCAATVLKEEFGVYPEPTSKPGKP